MTEHGAAADTVSTNSREPLPAQPLLHAKAHVAIIQMLL
jgi:hypothetical protein